MTDRHMCVEAQQRLFKRMISGIKPDCACRDGERSGYFKVTRMEQHAEPAQGFNFSFDWSGNSKTISKGTTYTFTPPHYNGYATPLHLSCCDLRQRLGAVRALLQTCI